MRQFRAARASGEVEQVDSVLAEALNNQNPTGRLHSVAVTCMLAVGPEIKTEIPSVAGKDGLELRRSFMSDVSWL